MPLFVDFVHRAATSEHQRLGLAMPVEAAEVRLNPPALQGDVYPESCDTETFDPTAVQNLEAQLVGGPNNR